MLASEMEICALSTLSQCKYKNCCECEATERKNTSEQTNANRKHNKTEVLREKKSCAVCSALNKCIDIAQAQKQ